MAHSPTDIELIRRVLHEGDARAFEVLMQRYTPQVLGAALRLTKDQDMAAEVVQMAFIQAYKSLSSWRGDNFGAWVTIIANHIALRMLEKEKRHRHLPLDNVQFNNLQSDDLQLRGEGIGEVEDEPYDEQKEQRLQSLEAAVSQLPEQERYIIEQHYYKGIPLATIARQLGQTENNIKVRLFRIREKLKKMILVKNLEN